MDKNIIYVGACSNYYGSLAVKEEDGKFFWSIENYNGFRWHEISEKLFELLIKEESNDE